MLRITPDITADGRLTIALAGRLTPEGCNTVSQLLGDAQNQRRQVAIDLAAVRLVDRPSVEYLAGLRRRGVTLVNLPPYVSRWVDQVSNARKSLEFGGSRRRQK